MPSNNHKAPSAGQKVDLGQNAPVTREGAGYVQSDSLAAESYREGGEFASNRNAEPTTKSSGTGRASQQPQFHEPARSSGFSDNHSKNQQIPSEEQGHPAPSYVNNQFIRDSSGPHGKNITEGFEDSSKYKDGMKAALNAEPGSINDPSRVAEQTFHQRNAAGAGLGHQSGQTGTEGGYEVLKAEESI